MKNRADDGALFPEDRDRAAEGLLETLRPLFCAIKKRFARRFIRPLVKTRKKQYNIKLGSVSADAHESKEARVA